jgi:hypothetical protein
MANRTRPAVYAGVPVPPSDPRPYVPTISLPEAREATFLCLHPQVIGFKMHWLENQHVPCPRDRTWCSGCQYGQTPRWCGFLGVVSLTTKNRFIMRFPESAFRESGLFRERSDARLLQGCLFTAYRFGRGHAKNRPAVIEIVTPDVPPPVPKPFPLFAALSRYWRMETLDPLEPCPVEFNSASPNEIRCQQMADAEFRRQARNGRARS